MAVGGPMVRPSVRRRVICLLAVSGIASRRIRRPRCGIATSALASLLLSHSEETAFNVITTLGSSSGREGRRVGTI